MSGHEGGRGGCPPGEGKGQLQVIRVKRKRAVQAPSCLYVQEEGRRDDVDLAQLSLEEDKGRKRPRTYRKMVTMTAEELGSASDVYLESMFTGSCTAEKAADEAELQHAYYDVVKRKRGRTAFEETESLPDPLRAFGKVCDVECRYDEEEEEEYVYDLYIARDDADDNAREHQPYFSIYDDDFHFPEEDIDHEDSFDDTEDSNAEGYYGNDYPDEGWSSEFSSEGYDYY